MILLISEPKWILHFMTYHIYDTKTDLKSTPQLTRVITEHNNKPLTPCLQLVGMHDASYGKWRHHFLYAINLKF